MHIEVYSFSRFDASGDSIRKCLATRYGVSKSFEVFGEIREYQIWKQLRRTVFHCTTGNISIFKSRHDKVNFSEPTSVFIRHRRFKIVTTSL
jgi:hypothetical protein